MARSSPAPKYLSPKELADRWRVSENTVRRMLRDGELPGAVQLRGAWRIPEDAPSQTAGGD